MKAFGGSLLARNGRKHLMRSPDEPFAAFAFRALQREPCRQPFLPSPIPHASEAWKVSFWRYKELGETWAAYRQMLSAERQTKCQTALRERRSRGQWDPGGERCSTTPLSGCVRAEL